MKKTHVTIVTGRSGSGKGTALEAFEDSGYYCVDNMPIALLPGFLELSLDSTIGFSGLVFGMDLRDNSFIHQYESVLDGLRQKEFTVRIIYIEAREEILLRRYSQTRRKHPLALGKGIHDAIQIEKKLLQPLRDHADHIVDTTNLNVHELRTVIRKMTDANQNQGPMRVQVMSFGFKYGLPVQSDLVMDVRFLKNPYFVESLRPLSGETEKIQSYVLNNNQTGLFLRKYFDLLDVLIPQYEKEGKSYLTIAIGCTGGRHRSVVIAKRLREHFSNLGLQTELIHRDIGKSNVSRGDQPICIANLSDER